MSVAMTAVTNRGAGGASRERVELILSHLDRLPALPTVVARLLAVTSSEDSSAGDVVSVIESDASLTAGILHMVRRADLGARDRAMTVARAVTLLGFRTVRNAALSSRFFDTLSTDQADGPTARTRRGLWEHSLGVACAAELIAEQTNAKKCAGEAFVCGLLHDVGKIALDVCLPKSYTRAMEYAEQRGACICDVESDIFGLDHTVAGKRLVTRWQLPQPIVECVWLHHQEPNDLPSSLCNPELVRMIHFADHLVRRKRIGYSGYRHVGDLDALAANLGLPAHALKAVCEQLPERMKPFRTLFGLEESADFTDAAESLATVNRRLSSINVQLTESNQRLSFRSQCLDAIALFTKTVGETDRVADVCAAAAEATARLVDARHAVAWVSPSANRCIHAGWFDGSSGRRIGKVFDFGSGETAESPGRTTSHSTRTVGPFDSCEESRGGACTVPTLPVQTGVYAAPTGCEELWERVTGTVADGLLWVLPWRGEGRCGGAMFVAEEHKVVRCRAATDDCAVLGRAFGLAISSARARIDAESMAEELLDLNRRCRAAEEQVVRVRSIAMVAEMAAGAAHELNNPLAVISGRAQMELGYALDPERRRAMEIIITQTQKASQIVLDLMGFAKPDPPVPISQPLATVFDRLLQHWRDASNLAVEHIHMGVSDPKLTVFADPTQLQEILVAVLANAVGAVDREVCWVKVNSPSPASDETVRIVVEDNGPGMAPEVLEHAFDPFFSNRPAGRGRGLGLSRAYRLAEINGGRLCIDSTVNVGTTVTIEIPSRAPTS